MRRQRRSVRAAIGGVHAAILGISAATLAVVTFGPFLSSAVAQRKQIGIAQPAAQPAAAAAPAEAAAEPDPGETGAIFFPADRAVLQRLSKAQELLGDKRYAEAVRLLGEILDGPEDYFFQPDKNQAIHRSLKAEAQRLIGELPAEARDSYELQFGAMARKMLEEAIESGDASQLAEVSRRFFHTKAGYTATHLVGLNQFDRGETLAAALSFQRLQKVPEASAALEPMLSLRLASCWLRAGSPEKAREVLDGLREKWAEKEIQLGGQPVRLFADGDPVETLRKIVAPALEARLADGSQWPMYRGNPSRNAISAGSSPLLSRRWSVPVTDENGAVEPVVDKLQQDALEHEMGLLPTLHPLAVDGYIFVRGVAGLVAIDFETGKRIWRGPTDDSVSQLLEPTAEYGATPAARGGGMQLGGRLRGNVLMRATPMNVGAGGSTLPIWLSERLWGDATYGTLSSDGRNVYCVEEHDMDISLAGGRMAGQVVLANGRIVNPGMPEQRPYNRLAAYEIATEGKLKWEIGGPAGAEDAGELAGACFLGAPLPLGGQLYALAEFNGEVRLIALDSESGAVRWSQQLAVLEADILADRSRRLSGSAPSYADGILVCPTSAGAVVAVDLTTRSLVWGYRYRAGDQNDETAERQIIRVGPGFAGVAQTALGSGTGWVDSSVTIAEGCVLLTPRESDELHCIDLVDGSLRWKRKRDDALYLACTHEGRALVVGRNTIKAYRLEDGSFAWETDEVTLPSGAMPSGRGFFNGQHYFLPLTSAEVVSIDVATGSIAGRVRSREGRVPGNLICYRGAVISQGPDSIERFDQRDQLWARIDAVLANNPENVPALVRRGELLLDDGRPADAAESLRIAMKLRPDERTGQLLVVALLDGLRSDFAAHRGEIAEIEQLVGDGPLRAAYLRVLASGMQQSGDSLGAFATYLRLAEADTENPLDRVHGVLSVRRDRWVNARLTELLSTAAAADREKMDRTIAARLQAAIDSPGPDDLRRFLSYFASHPLGDDAREALAQRLMGGDWLLEAELLLLELEQSPVPQRAGTATARMATLLDTAGRPVEAAAYYRRLVDRFADVVCDNGLTGRQIASRVPPDSIARRWLDTDRVWPVGKVEAETRPSSLRGRNFRFPIEVAGAASPFFRDVTVAIDQPQQSLIGVDGAGRRLWALGLRDANEPGNFIFNPQMCQAEAGGHALLVSTGYQLFAIDTLGGPGERGARILWHRDLSDAGGAAMMNVRQQVVQVPWGVPRLIAADSLGRPLGSIGPVLSGTVCYQRMRTVSAVDTLSADVLWTRTDVAPGCELFGDDEMLFLVPQGETEARVLRTIDGEDMGYRTVPRSNERMMCIGRRVLAWSVDGDRATIKLVDAWDGTTLWQRELAGDAKAWTVGQEAVGALDSKGRFVMLSLPDGRVLVDSQLEPEPDLAAIYIIRSRTRDLLVTNRPTRNVGGVHHQPLPGGWQSPLVDGHVHVFNRANGELVASTRIEKHGLLLSQPADLPVLVFATHVYNQNRPRNQAQQVQRVQTSLMFLDKRTGEIVYKRDVPQHVGAIDISGVPERQEVLLETPTEAVRLTFTGQPSPPAEAESAAEAEKTSSTEGEGAARDTVRAGRAILRGIQKWMAGETAGAESG